MVKLGLLVQKANKEPEAKMAQLVLLVPKAKMALKVPLVPKVKPVNKVNMAKAHSLLLRIQ